MDVVATMLQLASQYGGGFSAGTKNRQAQLQARLQELCGQLQRRDGDSAGRKELVRELKSVNSQLQQNQYDAQSRKLQEQHLRLLEQTEAKKWERWRRENNAAALTAASHSKLLSANGQHQTYNRFGLVGSGDDRQSVSRVSDAVESELADSRTLGVMAADAARRRKRQKNRDEAEEERQNRIRDKRHQTSEAYMSLELQRRKRKKVIDAFA
ncbi:MAG: hypothetical protein E6X17_07570 [Sporomusaceae bacterium]|nr:hypothetical protein [Sporomusaceae bacterium]